MNPNPDTKVCKVCLRDLHRRHYAPTGTLSKRTGLRTGDHTCRDCRAKERRVAGVRERRMRVRADGQIWCNHCERYLPTTRFKRHPTRPHTWWAYCVECTREIDRMRWRGERREKSNESRLIRQKEQQLAERRERTDFAVNALVLLRKRGLTKADIVRLTGVSWTTVFEIERRERRGTTPVVERLLIALRETAHLPTGKEPAYRRRLALPGFDELVARVRPLMDAYPTRSRWKHRDPEAAG